MLIKRCMVVVGEHSGDQIAAKVLEKLPQSVALEGLGGPALGSLGLKSLVPLEKVSVMGLWDVLLALPQILLLSLKLIKRLIIAPPDLLLLVDYAGLNLWLARLANYLKIRVVYMVPPKVWVWKSSRLAVLKKRVSRVLCLFRFEHEIMQRAGVRSEFMGHPLLEVAKQRTESPRAQHLPYCIALLPGSRASEIRRLLPSMLRVALKVQKAHPHSNFVMALASEELRPLVERCLSKSPLKIEVLKGLAEPRIRSARAAIVASGTATLEMTLNRVPMVVIYRVSALTYGLGKLLVSKIPFIALPNILSQTQVVPEFLQDYSDSLLFQSLMPLIEDSPSRTTMLLAYNKVISSLDSSNAAERGAAVIAEELGLRAN